MDRDAKERTADFGEVDLGFTEAEVRAEAATVADVVVAECPQWAVLAAECLLWAVPGSFLIRQPTKSRGR